MGPTFLGWSHASRRLGSWFCFSVVLLADIAVRIRVHSQVSTSIDAVGHRFPDGDGTAHIAGYGCNLGAC
jgi:hypothetical protein